MMLPLLEDLRQDGSRVRRRLWRAALFMTVLLSTDFAVWTVLARGLERYFGLDAGAEILLIGHSHTVLGVDKERLETLTGLRVAKYAREGANMADREVMIRHYLERHPRSVQFVVFGVDAHSFTAAGLSKNSYQLFLPFMADPTVRDFLAAQKALSGLEWGVRRVLRTARFNETTLALAVRGLQGNWQSYKRGQVDLARLEKQIANGDFRRIAFEATEQARFEALREFLRARGIRLILAYYPTVDVLNRAEPERFAQAMALLAGFANPEQGVWLLDYNAEYAGRHELFFDPIHLNVDGQAVITERLARDLNALRAGNVERQPLPVARAMER
ncbi:MAG: hypothetical protein ABTR20_06460 [Candidatus Competibacter sp.]